MPGEKEKSVDEAREVREILLAVTDFLKSIKEPVKELIYVVVDALNGEKLGKEVAAFYRTLVDNGVPEDLAREMSREFLSKKLEAAPSIGKLLNTFTGSLGRRPKIIVSGREGGARILGSTGESKEKKGGEEEESKE